jgi:hypothetical protein
VVPRTGLEVVTRRDKIPSPASSGNRTEFSSSRSHFFFQQVLKYRDVKLPVKNVVTTVMKCEAKGER